MSLLLFIALAGYLVASRINQSAVVGEILVGLIVGPSFLGLITYTDFIHSIASLGAIILLFVIGFEFNIREITDPKYAVIAFFGVLLPWGGGYAIAGWFGYSFTSALFVGTAMTATSIAITAHVLKEMGKLQTRAAQAIIGAAVIDDVLSLLFLAATDDMVSGTFTLTGLGIVIIKAILFIAIFGYIGFKYVNRGLMALDNYAIAQRYPEFAFITAMMIAFLYAMSADLLGLSGIVGAFLAGVSMESVVLKKSKNLREGAEYLQIIFASIFFVSLGILVDVHELTTGAVIFLAILTVAAIVTKLIGCGLTARILGFSNQDSFIIGFGMGPRGEVAMIVALIGLSKGIINQDIYVSIVFMSLFTTIITPLIYRNWIFRQDEGTPVS